MSITVPQVGLARMLDEIIADTLTIRLFSNNHTPAATDTSADYTEVAGGGYAAIPLVSASWTTVAGNPSSTTYATYQQFDFTGPTTSPGTVFGYYITRASGEVVYAQLLYPTNPIVPINTVYVKVKPKITLDQAS